MYRRTRIAGATRLGRLFACEVPCCWVALKRGKVGPDCLSNSVKFSLCLKNCCLVHLSKGPHSGKGVDQISWSGQPDRPGSRPLACRCFSQTWWRRAPRHSGDEEASARRYGASVGDCLPSPSSWTQSKCAPVCLLALLVCKQYVSCLDFFW